MSNIITGHCSGLIIVFILVICLQLCVLQGTDQTMLNKLHSQHGRNKNYLKPKSEMNMVFGLNHFAGVVFYDAKGQFKNKDYSIFKDALVGDLNLFGGYLLLQFNFFDHPTPSLQIIFRFPLTDFHLEIIPTIIFCYPFSPLLF